MKRDLIAVIWSLLVTGAISKWAFHVAYLERGYKAVGGEYLVILVAYVAAWKAINYLFDSLEELEEFIDAIPEIPVIVRDNIKEDARIKAFDLKKRMLYDIKEFGEDNEGE